jgi:sec-independent protein translocase protein TatB
VFGLGFWELIVIAVVALLFVGPDKLPEATRKISKGIRDFRRQTKELQKTLNDDHELGTAVRELKNALRGDDLPPMRPRTTTTPVGPATPATVTAPPPTPQIAEPSAPPPAEPPPAEPEPVEDPGPVIAPAAEAIARGSEADPDKAHG